MAVDEPACGNRHQEIAEIGGDLDQGRLGDGDIQGILEVLVEHIQDRPCKSP
jgi:hypothetical protein